MKNNNSPYILIESEENVSKKTFDALVLELRKNGLLIIKRIDDTKIVFLKNDFKRNFFRDLIKTIPFEIKVSDVYRVRQGYESFVKLSNAILLELNRDNHINKAREYFKNDVKKVIPKIYIIEYNTQEEAFTEWNKANEQKDSLVWLEEVEIIQNYLGYKSLRNKSIDNDAIHFLTCLQENQTDNLRFYNSYLEALNTIEKPPQPFEIKNTPVGILDFGVDYEHQGIFASFPSKASSRDFTNSDSSLPEKRMAHGTLIAGVIAGDIVIPDFHFSGIAPKIPLLNAKIFKHESITHNILTIIKGIYWVYEEKKCRVLSCSWVDTYNSKILSNYIDYCSNPNRDDGGAVFIFAAGNEGTKIDEPASLPNVIAVGAINLQGRPIVNDNLYRFRTNTGYGITTCAVGEYILSTDNTADRSANRTGVMAPSDFYIINGTSAAVPQVSATVAILLEKEPKLTSLQIKNKILEANSTLENWDYSFGKGILNINKCLTN